MKRDYGRLEATKFLNQLFGIVLVSPVWRFSNGMISVYLVVQIVYTKKIPICQFNSKYVQIVKNWILRKAIKNIANAQSLI